MSHIGNTSKVQTTQGEKMTRKEKTPKFDSWWLFIFESSANNETHLFNPIIRLDTIYKCNNYFFRIDCYYSI